MSLIKTILFIAALSGFAVAFFVQYRLYKYVSREKILEVQDVKILWKNAIPPKEVLSERGLILYRYFQFGVWVFVGGCFILVVSGFFDDVQGFSISRF